MCACNGPLSIVIGTLQLHIIFCDVPHSISDSLSQMFVR